MTVAVLLSSGKNPFFKELFSVLDRFGKRMESCNQGAVIPNRELSVPNSSSLMQPITDRHELSKLADIPGCKHLKANSVVSFSKVEKRKREDLFHSGRL